MTEIEKIQYTKDFIDMMAKGINPLDGTPIPDDDILNNVRISRCMYFVSDVLRQIIENGRIGKTAKIPFSITPEQLVKYDFGSYPITATELTRKIYSLAENNNMEKITYKPLTKWLMNINMLYEKKDEEGKLRKYPTVEGEKIGITCEKRSGHRGEYEVILYNRDAQKFIIYNIDAIIASI